MNEIIQTKVGTIDGRLIDITEYSIGRYIRVPLLEVKCIEWSDILKRQIPIHFEEIFEECKYVWSEKEGDYEKGNYTLFKSWRSIGIE